MDSSIASDPRFELVGERLGLELDAIIGKCFRLWLVCYERRSDTLRKREVDVAVKSKGFADALIAENLADDSGDEVVIHGVKSRIVFLQQQAERGRMGGEKGKGKPKRKPRKANAKQTLSQTKSTHSVGSKANTLTLTPALDQSLTLADFERVYEIYPRKQGKKTGMAKVQRMVTTREDYDALRRAVEKMAKGWRGQDTTYCPHWSSFVSQERWRDDDLPMPSVDQGRPAARPVPSFEPTFDELMGLARKVGAVKE
jgi:hypothetical protein